MDQELKAKWVKALRSGEFKQLSPGGSDWTRDGMHCCIGVLGELLGHQLAMREHHFRSRLVDVLPENSVDALIDLNDRDGKTFSEIADYIEANL